MSEAMQPGLLIVYSGPSGVGKGTILAPYLAAHPETVLSVSVTTRAPRPGERDGIDYSFITRERFDELLERFHISRPKGMGVQTLPEALHAAPAETLVFEDSLYALKTAKTAGYRTVGVLDAHGETDQAGLKEAAEVYLTSLTEFPGHWEPLNK